MCTISMIKREILKITKEKRERTQREIIIRLFNMCAIISNR